MWKTEDSVIKPVPSVEIKIRETAIMKTAMKCMAVLTCAGLMAGTAAAQNNHWKHSNRSGQTATHAKQNWHQQKGHWARHAQFCDSRHLLHRQVTNDQGKKLGRIRDVIFSQRSGRAYAAIGVTHRRWAVVPVQALKMGGARRHMRLTLNTTWRALRNGPTVAENHWRESLTNPGFIRRVNRRYNSQTMGMGGAGNNGMTGRGMGHSMGMGHNRHMGMGRMGHTNGSWNHNK